jgi:hypothetical protein
MTMPAIKSATTADEEALIAVITLAFSTDPVVRWMYPNPHQHLTHFPPFVRAFGGSAFAYLAWTVWQDSEDASRG